MPLGELGSHARCARLAINRERGFAAHSPDCIAAAFGNIPPEAYPPPRPSSSMFEASRPKPPFPLQAPQRDMRRFHEAFVEGAPFLACIASGYSAASGGGFWSPSTRMSPNGGDMQSVYCAGAARAPTQSLSAQSARATPIRVEGDQNPPQESP